MLESCEDDYIVHSHREWYAPIKAEETGIQMAANQGGSRARKYSSEDVHGPPTPVAARTHSDKTPNMQELRDQVKHLEIGYKESVYDKSEDQCIECTEEGYGLDGIIPMDKRSTEYRMHCNAGH